MTESEHRAAAARGEETRQSVFLSKEYHYIPRRCCICLAVGEKTHVARRRPYTTERFRNRLHFLMTRWPIVCGAAAIAMLLLLEPGDALLLAIAAFMGVGALLVLGLLAANFRDKFRNPGVQVGICRECSEDVAAAGGYQPVVYGRESDTQFELLCTNPRYADVLRKAQEAS